MQEGVGEGLFFDSTAARATLFNTPTNNPFIVIAQFQSTLDSKKLMSIVGEEILESNEEECIDITGHEKEFLPPISIYEIKIIIDKSLEKKNYLFFRIDKKKFLKVSMKAIVETNTEVSFEKVTR